MNLKSLMNTIATDGEITVDGFKPADTEKFYGCTDCKSYCLIHSLETYENVSDDWYEKAICIYDYAVLTLCMTENNELTEYTLFFVNKDKLIVGLYYLYEFNSYRVEREDDIYIASIFRNTELITEFDLELLPKGCVKVDEYKHILRNEGT